MDFSPIENFSDRTWFTKNKSFVKQPLSKLFRSRCLIRACYWAPKSHKLVLTVSFCLRFEKRTHSDLEENLFGTLDFTSKIHRVGSLESVCISRTLLNGQEFGVAIPESNPTLFIAVGVPLQRYICLLLNVYEFHIRINPISSKNVLKRWISGRACCQSHMQIRWVTMHAIIRLFFVVWSNIE